MRKIALICSKELKVCFGSAIGYMIVSAFLALSGIAFFYWVNRFRLSSMRAVFQVICLVLLLTAPAITMRLLAGEFRSGTAELLLISPVAPIQIVLGKFLFCVLLVLSLLFCTFHFPLLLMNYGRPDMGEVLTGYIGLLLAGCFFCSVGLFASSLTRNNAVAAITAILILLGLFLLPQGKTGELSLAGTISPFERFASFAKGVFDTSDAAYFVIATCFFLLLTERILRLRQRI